jgi:hypothetical protein
MMIVLVVDVGMMIVLMVVVVMMIVPVVVVVMMIVPKVVVVLVEKMRGITLVIMMIDMGEGHVAAVQVTDEVGAGATVLRGTEVQ